jgi:hypothetical protein
MFDHFLFLGFLTVEGWRGSGILFFGTVKRGRVSGNFGEWGEFDKHRDFQYIFPDLSENFGFFLKFGQKNPDLF